MYIILSFVFMGLITTQDATEPIELFGYENPPHEDQVLEVSKLAHVILQRAQWKRNFNSEACPELTHEVCPEGQVCYPPTAPPPYPPNVCDLPEYMFDSDCAPDAECTDPTKCPVPLCIIESTRRVPVEGAVDCIPEDCKEGGQYYGTEHCRPVTRCDLTYWVDVLEECKSNPPNACQTYPHLCVNFCDITEVNTEMWVCLTSIWGIAFTFFKDINPVCQITSCNWSTMFSSIILTSFFTVFWNTIDSTFNRNSSCAFNNT